LALTLLPLGLPLRSWRRGLGNSGRTGQRKDGSGSEGRELCHGNLLKP
jgi:hypothetical protein